MHMTLFVVQITILQVATSNNVFLYIIHVYMYIKHTIICVFISTQKVEIFTILYQDYLKCNLHATVPCVPQI